MEAPRGPSAVPPPCPAPRHSICQRERQAEVPLKSKRSAPQWPSAGLARRPCTVSCSASQAHSIYGASPLQKAIARGFHKHITAVPFLPESGQFFLGRKVACILNRISTICKKITTFSFHETSQFMQKKYF